MKLSELPIDLFIQQITYLPFDSVISVCNTDSKSHSYCTDTKYNNQWKALIDHTFGNVYDYQDKLNEVWTNLGGNETTLGGNETTLDNKNIYNYLVYTQLIKYLDPVTQAMIYYKQGDNNSFNRFSLKQKILAMFLLGNKQELDKYLQQNYNDNLEYLPYDKVLEGEKIEKIEKNALKDMFYEMVNEGNIQGVKYFLPYINPTVALTYAYYQNKLNIIKYMVDNGIYPFSLLELAAGGGKLNIVKYLFEKKIATPEELDRALNEAIINGRLNVVQYLINNGTKPKRYHLDVAITSEQREIVNILRSSF